MKEIRDLLVESLREKAPEYVIIPEIYPDEFRIDVGGHTTGSIIIVGTQIEICGCVVKDLADPNFFEDFLRAVGICVRYNHCQDCPFYDGNDNYKE